MKDHITKPWDWSKNTEDIWLIPSTVSAYLAERWHSLRYTDFLDMGCGLGRHSIYMAGKGFNVTAVDLSDYAVNHLNEWADKEKLKIDARISNMLQLPFGDNSFDSIMSYNVIYHTDKKGFLSAMEEIKRVLRADGELFLTLISKDSISFKEAEPDRKLDENTVLREESDTEKDVPHFYVDIDDIKVLFSDWEFLRNPFETASYSIDRNRCWSKHWELHLRKRYR